MKIQANGTPIWLSPRDSNGIIIIQGTSRIYLSAAEVDLLIDGLATMRNTGNASISSPTPRSTHG